MVQGALAGNQRGMRQVCFRENAAGGGAEALVGIDDIYAVMRGKRFGEYLPAAACGNDGDMLAVRLPDGEQRFTVVRGRGGYGGGMVVADEGLCGFGADGDGGAGQDAVCEEMFYGIGAGK